LIESPSLDFARQRRRRGQSIAANAKSFPN
jgi:hypothetical protein